MRQIRKAVIPAAGLGTRFLPATKSVPKEMLTIVDAPIIFYVVKEAVDAGIEDIILVQGRGKTAIEDFFDTSYELEDRLAKSGKNELLDQLKKIRDMANIISVRQKSPLGLGHAVLCARNVVGDSPFAVLLGDEIMTTPAESAGDKNTTQTLSSVFTETGSSTVAIMEVPLADTSKYGIADVTKISDSLFKVNGLIEKPKAASAPSRWALPGRYALSADIFSILAEGKPSLNGELQLTDSLNVLAQKKEVLGSTFKSLRYDAGDRFGYLKANIEIALSRPDIRVELHAYLKELQLQNFEAGAQ